MMASIFDNSESIHPQLRDGCGEEENGGVEQYVE